MQNPQLFQIIPLFLPKSSDIKKSLLEPFRTDQGDAFTYPGHLRMSSGSKNTLRWKKSFKFSFPYQIP